MNVTSAHSPTYNSAGSIDLLVQFDQLATEVAFTATPNDTEEHGKALYANALAGMYGPVTPYVSPITLQQAQDIKSNALQAVYQNVISQPLEYMGHAFDADQASRDLVQNCLIAGAVPPNFFWVSADNAEVPMSFTDLQGLAMAMIVQGQTAFVHLRGLKAQVKAAATVEEVQAITW